MKQTEIDYQQFPNATVKFVGFRNVADQIELDKDMKNLEKLRRYYCGRAYYTLATIGEPNIIRITNQHELHALGSNGYQDFKIGESYPNLDWAFFIQFLKSAGERYTRIHHIKEEELVLTIKI